MTEELDAVRHRIRLLLSASDAEPFERILDSLGVLRAVNAVLVSENAHMRGNLAARAQELIVAFHEQKRLRAALEAIAAKECVTPDIHFVQVVDIARRALDRA